MTFLRYLLFPFSFIYGVVTWLRNKLFDWGGKKELTIPYPSICVGNLSVGGTGKTPHVLLFNSWLSNENDVVIISRGYGRKTKGLIVANQDSDANEIGDEPMLFHCASPQPQVIVSEKRVEAIKYLIENKNKNKVIILDDAFQHRHVKAGLNVLLCDYSSPYFKDFMLPTGNLREFRIGEKRADMVIVTKCPDSLSLKDKQYFYKGIDQPESRIYFSKIAYTPIEKWGEFDLPKQITNIVLVTGIANPKPLENHLSKSYTLKSVIFPDHHTFTNKDIKTIHENFGNFASENTIILTTEKDAMRLELFKRKGDLKKYPWFIQKIGIEIDKEKDLKEKLRTYVRAV